VKNRVQNSPFKCNLQRYNAVQPNLGQGGGQAIESAYALADELSQCEGKRGVKMALMKYTSRRFLRVSSIHGEGLHTAVESNPV
jgi:2-polyprenyl-6-methoxyphenol hydroxylase-like FAD-dependent oxidoreductase